MYCLPGSIDFRIMHVFLAAIVLLFSGLPVVAGPLDDYYLSQYAVQRSGDEYVKSTALEAAAEESAHCGTPLKHGLQRDWNKLELTTQKVLAKQLASPVLSGSEATILSPSGRFMIHYTTSGGDAVPSLDWVQTVAQTFDNVAAAYLARSWRLAPTMSGAPYDVYLRDLALQRIYGQATSNQALPSTGYSNAFGSFIEIDNNFTDSVYVNASGGPFGVTQSLQITAAHEYHHAIQYGYNFFFDIWYAEATSTWQEDELYDGVNQLYNYIPGWINNSALPLDTTTSTATGGGYGRWIFNRYLAEQHGSDVVRKAWDKLAALNSPGNNADIPMVPVLESQLLSAPVNSSLGADTFGFARRVYLRDWTSHTGEVNRIHPYTPVTTLNNFPASSATTLAHYSFAYYRLTPAALALPDLTISVSGNSGIAAAVFKKAGGVITEVISDDSGKVFTVTDFSSLNPATDEVVMLMANTTDVDNQSASFNASNSGSQQLRSLTLLFGGTGGGNVNGNISCSSGGTCAPVSFAINEKVTLLASPNTESLFDSWSGDCSSKDNCLLTMDTNKTVTANFSYVKPARINRTPALPFDTLAAAYENAITGDTIQARLFDFASPAGLVLGRNINLTIEGGYNAAYSANPDMTTIQGPLVLQGGAVTVERVTIR